MNDPPLFFSCTAERGSWQFALLLLVEVTQQFWLLFGGHVEFTHMEC